MVLKLYYRNFFKNIWPNLVSLTGLSVGMMVVILSLSYIVFETSFDHFHRKSKRIFTAYTKISMANGEYIRFSSDPGLKNYLEANIPFVESVCRLMKFSGNISRQGSVLRNISGFYTDADFFDLFDYNMILGKHDLISDPGNIIVTRALADKLAGQENCYGTTINLGDQIFNIVGIIEDPPENSNLHFDFLLPYSVNQGAESMVAGSDETNLYILTNDRSIDLKVVKESVDGFYVSEGRENEQSVIIPLEELHQYLSKTRDGFLIYVAISIMVLITSVLNYIFYYYSRSEIRIREIGLRKLNGASCRSLFTLMTTDSLITVSIAAAIGMLLAKLFLPEFQRLISIDLQLFGPGLWKTEFLVVLLAVIIGIMTGFIISIRYSIYNAADLIKGMVSKSHHSIWIKSYLCMQFTISGGMLALVIIFFMQLEYLRDIDMGYEIDNRLLFTMPPSYASNYITIHGELERIAEIEQVTGRQGLFGTIDMALYLKYSEGESADRLFTYGLIVKDDFFETYGMKIIEGKSFSDVSRSDSNLIIIDEYTAEQLGLADPVGAKFSAAGMNVEVIGVCNNAEFIGLNTPKQPMIYTQLDDKCKELTVKYIGKEKDIREQVVAVLKEMDPFYDPECRRLDEAVSQLYKEEINLTDIIAICGILAIVLSMIGAYAIASYLSERRLKQNAVRRILGASVSNITVNSVTTIITPALTGALLACPVVYFISGKWFSNFTRKVDIGVLPYLISVFVIIVLAATTVYFISRRSAMRNPGLVLKQE